MQGCEKYHATQLRKIAVLVQRNLFARQIFELTEDIKYLMKKTWMKMANLEDSMKDLRCTKMPLISYGAENPKIASLFPNPSKKKFFKFVKKVTPDTKNENVPSAIEMMKCWGYAVFGPNWQELILSETPAHWIQETLPPWERVKKVLKLAGFFQKNTCVYLMCRQLRKKSGRRKLGVALKSG